MSEIVLADTGYWIALFDPGDQHHSEISGTIDLFESSTLIMPWPILYETLRTQFVRKALWVTGLDARLKRPGVVFIDDSGYCQAAYELTVEYSTRRGRAISMVDMLCRMLIDDPSVRVDYMLTPNARDFHDVCTKNRVELLL